MTTLEILIAARKLIERPENWSSRGWGSGRRRCALHAIKSAAGRNKWAAQMAAERAIETTIGINCLGAFNDSHTHAEVLAAFDRATEAEKTNAPA